LPHFLFATLNYHGMSSPAVVTYIINTLRLLKAATKIIPHGTEQHPQTVNSELFCYVLHIHASI